jgi:uncharacterized protein YhbP (UPF0306 family)
MQLDLEKIVREYIDKSPHMSLGTVSDGKPWVCEVHFAYDKDLNLYFRSKPTTRHSQEITDNPNVAGNIVRQHALDEYPHAIYFEGTAEMVTDETQFETLCGYFMQRGIGNESMIDDAKKDDGHKFYKITVKNWYAFGKFGGDSGQKHKLTWNGGEK